MRPKSTIVEGEQALSTSTIRRWIATLKDKQEEIKDKARSGRTREAVKLPRSRILLAITRQRNRYFL